MSARAVSSVARVADAAADAVQDAANAAHARVHDFTRNLTNGAADTNRAPVQPANDDWRAASLPAESGQQPQPNQVNGGDPTVSPTGALSETSRAGDIVVNPRNEIDKLNSDGDQVVMSMTGEGKLQIPLVRVPLGVGGKGQYGYDITVAQVGGAGQGRAPSYDMTFDKNLLAGGIVEPVVSGVDPALELNLTATNSVTMNFDSRADATRAVEILQRLAVTQTVRDAGQAAVPAPSDPTTNPVVDDSSSGLPSLPSPTDPIADRIAPSQTDMNFLRDNITGYTQIVGAQERAKVTAKFANLGIEPRLDGNQQISRTVELPHDGQPGRLTYTISGDLQASTKERLTIGQQLGDQAEIGYVPQNIVDHGQLRGEISMSWDLPPSATDSTVSGQPVPEASSLSGGEGLGGPDQVSARLQLDYQNQSLTDLSRTDMQRISFEASTRNPGAHAAPLINNLLQGDLEGAFRGMGDDFTVTAEREFVHRNGVHQQHEIGFEQVDVFEAKLSLIGNIGRDDITNRRTATFTGTEIANRLGGPQQPAPNEPSTPSQPPESNRPDQLVVVPSDGLNVRAQPSTDGTRVSVFQHGTFVQPTGARQADAQGNDWIEVRGPDVNDRSVQGWVAAEHVRPHPAGAMDQSGRINPELEQQGYRAHVVQPDDTIWDLAHRDGVAFRDMVQLNGDHLINPSLIFPGDKVYIPGTGRAQPPAPPPAEPQPPAPQPSTPSSPSQSGSPSEAPSEAPSGAPSQPSASGAPSGSSSDAPSQPQASGAPSGSPSQPPAGSPSGSEPSQPPASSAPSGSESEAPNDAPSGQPPAQPSRPTPSTGERPDLDRILRDYQMPADPGGMIMWEPSGGPLEWGARQFFTDPIEVTATEGRIFDDMSVFEVNDLKNLRDGASNLAEERYPTPQDKRGNFSSETGFLRWARNDGHMDAFRHAYASALLTKEYGADFAERLTLAHEGDPRNPADREAMDLYNNEVGRRIAGENPDASKEELADLVQQAIENGELVVIDRAGNLAWSDQVRYGEHGTANDGPAPGTMQRPEAGGPPAGS